MENYQSLALKTESKPDVSMCIRSISALRVLHAAMGIATEVAEYHPTNNETNQLEELGDICWYCAIGLDAVGYKLQMVSPSPADFADVNDAYRCLHIASGDLLDHLKRNIFYGAEIHPIKISDWLLYIMGAVHYLAVNSTNVAMVDVLYANIAKLHARYKGKFSSENALVRDLEAELDTLKNARFAKAFGGTP